MAENVTRLKDRGVLQETPRIERQQVISGGGGGLGLTAERHE